MTSFREQYTTFILIGLFVFAIISFGLTLQLQNGIDENETLLSNDVINRTYARLGENLSEIGTEAQTQKDSFESEVPERGFGSLIIFAIVGVAQSFGNGIIAVYNIIIVLPASVLGVPSQVISALTSILLVSLTLLAWRVYRSGN